MVVSEAESMPLKCWRSPVPNVFPHVTEQSRVLNWGVAAQLSTKDALQAVLCKGIINGK